ncbi:phage terminase large subunit [Deinococcus alpinitundrae]|uniref:phage terminase large subunit n=1 Tax=Deinococcus alpinitundrae TaxID=468913 RepID=UPI001ED8DE6B|nr:phage terminase large subunit [Deinococcus alpinitundrae]
MTALQEPLPAGALLYEPLGAARELFFARDAEVVLDGPAGTGKSRGILEKLNALALKYPGMRALIVRKTRASLTDTTLVTWEEHVHPGCDTTNQQRRVRQSYTYPNGSEIVVGGMDKSIKIMSSEYDIICAFEATEFYEEDWEAMTTRLRNGVMPYQQLLGDCNPGAPGHWLNVRMKRGQARRILCQHEDNPRLFDRQGKLTGYGQDYISKLDNLTGVRYQRLRKGQWVAAEGMVYSDWDDKLNLVEFFDPPSAWSKIRVVDFGYTNPFVCQWWAIDPDGRMFLYREIYFTHRLVEDHAAQIRELSGSERYEATICDHDAEDRATLERYLRCSTLPAYKAVTTGIQAVEGRIRPAKDGKPRLTIMRGVLVETDVDLVEAKKPTNTYDELPGYVYPTSKAGVTEKEAPVKRDDHGMDTMRYACAYVDQLGERKPARTAGDAMAAMQAVLSVLPARR